MARSKTKSAVQFARAAYRVGQQALPRYGKPRSQKRYTQPQLFALLALKEFFHLDYRALVVRVAEWRELREALELTGPIPHYSTLCLAHARLLKKGGPKAR
jgi:hypothetical protein